ncbi:MAG: MraY family glycosyltransferase, partial [Lysobacterales bacterium]
MIPNGATWILPLTVVLTAALALLLMPLARGTGWVDHPGGRKVHETPTPLAGGWAIFIVCAAVLALTVPHSRFVQALGAGGLLMFLTGLVDDRKHIPFPVRFLLQVVACAIVMAWAGVRLDDFGQLFTSNVRTLGILSAPITVFAALGVINAYNMIDGMDGLAGSIFLVGTGGMALFAGMNGQLSMLWLLLVAAAAVLGFMLLNVRSSWNPRARLFLGDSGSLLLGFTLAWCFIRLGNDHEFGAVRAFVPMTAVWLFAVPLLDTSTQIWRRFRAGASPFQADQEHLHHAFLRAGYSTGEAWLNITLLAAALGGFGILVDVSALPEYLSFWFFIAFAFAYYFYMRHSWEKQRFLGRNFVYADFGEPA